MAGRCARVHEIQDQIRRPFSNDLPRPGNFTPISYFHHKLDHPIHLSIWPSLPPPKFAKSRLSTHYRRWNSELGCCLERRARSLCRHSVLDHDLRLPILPFRRATYALALDRAHRWSFQYLAGL